MTQEFAIQKQSQFMQNAEPSKASFRILRNLIIHSNEISV